MSLHLESDYCNPVTSVAPELLVSTPSRFCSASITFWYQFSQSSVFVFSVRFDFFLMRSWGFTSPAQFSFSSCSALLLLIYHPNVHKLMNTFYPMGIFYHIVFNKDGDKDRIVNGWYLSLKFFLNTWNFLYRNVNIVHQFKKKKPKQKTHSSHKWYVYRHNLQMSCNFLQNLKDMLFHYDTLPVALPLSY